MKKPTCYLTSPVFREMSTNNKVSANYRTALKELFDTLESVADVIESKERFPDAAAIASWVKTHNVDFIGCHLSHPVTTTVLMHPTIKAVCTATAGYNHIDLTQGVLVTHTPGVLHQAVADFTLAMILTSLKNITSLNTMVWKNGWTRDQKWDMDAFLGDSIREMTIGIVGLGQIGTEVALRLLPWDMKLLYHSRTRKKKLENSIKTLDYAPSLEQVFKESDIVSLHMPLTEKTHHMVNSSLLKLMKPGALLVNTARGDVLDFDALLALLESGEIAINLAFDVFDPEPLPESILERFRSIKQKNSHLDFIFLPHTASADADTRAKMTAMMIEDLITLSTATSKEELSGIRLIPEHRKQIIDASGETIRLFSTTPESSGR